MSCTITFAPFSCSRMPNVSDLLNLLACGVQLLNVPSHNFAMFEWCSLKISRSIQMVLLYCNIIYGILTSKSKNENAFLVKLITTEEFSSVHEGRVK